MTVVDAIRAFAAEAPAHPAIVVHADDRVISYGELVGTFDAHAKRLRAEGVRPGDRCGLVARQGAGFIEAALGVLAADACLVPIPDDHRGAVLDAFAARAQLHQCLREEAGGFALDLRRDVGSVDGAGDEDFRALAPAYLRFTSGTTSRRKGVILGHATVEARLAAANRALAIGPSDRILWLLPLAHHFVVSILLYLRHGATVLLPAGSLARAVLDCATARDATVLYASPFHVNALAHDDSPARLDGLRLAISTAEGLRRDDAERFVERYGLAVTQALGIIEVGLPIWNAAAARAKPDALGRPLPDYDVWLRAEDGTPLAGPTSPERTGEICIRGPGLLDAYLEPWLPARELLGADGFRTGDQAWRDADGDLHLVGRRANRINMAGMKFFAEEVEAVLDAHPGVRRSRVRAREHAHVGEIPVAEIVAATPGSPPERRELVAHCRAALPAYKVPRAFEVVDDLPLTETGKLRRADG